MPSRDYYDNEKSKTRPWNTGLLLKISIIVNVVLLIAVLCSVTQPHGSSRVAKLGKAAPKTNTTAPVKNIPVPACTNTSYLDINITQQQRFFQDQHEPSGNHSSVIGGWLTPANTLMALGIMRAQTRACITGSVGEIGVHHGKHFLAMLLGVLPQERALAVDLFEQQQQLNVDRSGKGNSSVFLTNVVRYGFSPDRVTMLAADSSKVKPAELAKEVGGKRFRFFSVDGGHSYDLTMSDLKLAAALLQPGGVIALDDVPNVGWLGVQEAMYDFLSLNRSIAPFLYSCQKMYFTTAEHHESYLKLADQLPCGKCTFSLKYHPSRYSIRDWPLCVKLTSKAGKGGSDACETCQFSDMPLNTLALPPGLGAGSRDWGSSRPAAAAGVGRRLHQG